jgi:hypothetical protein
VQDHHRAESTTDVVDSTGGNVNPFAPANETPAAVDNGGSATVALPFAEESWGDVHDGLLLVFNGNLGVLAAKAVQLVLAQYGAGGALAGAAILLLPGLTVLWGKWICRAVPVASGLRGPITIACLAFTVQWLSGAATSVLNHWLQFGQTSLTVVRFSTGLAELVGMGCFLWFLSLLAQRSRHARLVSRAKLLFGSFMLFYSFVVLSRLVSWNSTGHLPHDSHVVHHLRPFGVLFALALVLPFLGVMIAWVVSYLSLIKSLADNIEESSGCNKQ